MASQRQRRRGSISKIGGPSPCSLGPPPLHEQIMRRKGVGWGILRSTSPRNRRRFDRAKRLARPVRTEKGRHAPFSLLGVEHEVRSAIADDLKLDDGESSLNHSKLNGRRIGEVQNPAVHIGPPIRNPHSRMFPVRQINDPNHAPQRQCPMGRSEGAHVEPFPARRDLPVKLSAIPRRHPPLLDPDVQQTFAGRHPGAGANRETRQSPQHQNRLNQRPPNTPRLCSHTHQKHRASI